MHFSNPRYIIEHLWIRRFEKSPAIHFKAMVTDSAYGEGR